MGKNFAPQTAPQNSQKKGPKILGKKLCAANGTPELRKIKINLKNPSKIHQYMNSYEYEFL